MDAQTKKSRFGKDIFYIEVVSMGLVLVHISRMGRPFQELYNNCCGWNQSICELPYFNQVNKILKTQLITQLESFFKWSV